MLAVATGWLILDPLLAILVALNIMRTGVKILRRSLMGLLDTSIPEELQHKISEILVRHASEGVRFHALSTRQAAARRFISVHILVPGDWTVHDAHHIAEDFEADIRSALGGVVTVFTHLEPVEDELSMEDMFLDR